MDKTISIRSTGTASAAPDTIELTITLKSQSMDYHATMVDAANKHAHILSLLLPLGFTREMVKTLQFGVDVVYENAANGMGGQQRLFRGYACVHQLRLTFPFSMQRLAQVLSYLARSEAMPELSIRFKLKDEKTLRAKALVNATAEAYRRATVLTQASRTALGGILEIRQGEDGQGAFELNSQTAFCGTQRAAMLMEAGLDIQPENITAQETVTIIWALK